MTFKRTSPKPLYMAFTKEEITEIKNGFGLRSKAARIETANSSMHTLRGHVSPAAAVAAHRTPAEAIFHVRVRFQAIENLDHVAMDDHGMVVHVARQPFALNRYEFEVQVPNVQTQEWDWLAVGYYRLAAPDFNQLVLERAHQRGKVSVAPKQPLSRGAWFSMMRRNGRLRTAAQAA
jgi:hypothetical protein